MEQQKNLVVYYSLQGNTKRVANLLAEALSADILELKMKRNYNLPTAATLGLVHIKSGHTPELDPIDVKLEKYDKIFIGTPVWWYTYVPPLRTFITKSNLVGKNIMLLSTHAGDNGQTFTNMRKLLSDANVLSHKDFYNVNKRDASELKKEVMDWVSKTK